MTKPHYLILDGLRGVAALLVVIFHLFESHFHVLAEHPMGHGYLAVDFFFLLSGFVIGYAYDDRWSTMTVLDFFKIRLVRLHPMVILSVLLGAIMFSLDPNMHASATALLITLLISLTLLPSPDLRGWGETHSLNGPCWSLFQEYIGNFIYALGARKLNRTGLGVLVILSAAALAITAIWRGDLGTGWGYQTIWIAFVRMMFPFFAGLWLYRYGFRLRWSRPLLMCSMALAIVFFVPWFSFNGIVEVLLIIMVFPIIVAAGAGSELSPRMTKVCRWLGDISYPLYITHYTIIYWHIEWVEQAKPSAAAGWKWGIILFLLFIAIAQAALKLYDEPVRKYLKRTWLAKHG